MKANRTWELHFPNQEAREQWGGLLLSRPTATDTTGDMEALRGDSESDALEAMGHRTSLTDFFDWLAEADWRDSSHGIANSRATIALLEEMLRQGTTAP